MDNESKNNRPTPETYNCCAAIVEGMKPVNMTPVTLAFIEALRTAQQAYDIASIALLEWGERFSHPDKEDEMWTEKMSEALVNFKGVIWEMIVEHMKEQAFDYTKPDVYATKI